MGRIADALKKAEEERRRTLAESESSGGVAVADPQRFATNRMDALSPSLGVQPSTRPVISFKEGIDEAIVSYYDRSSMVAEQYRSLRTRLLTQNPQNDHRVFAITSSIPKEGKSVTTLNLGFILAEIRHLKVVCVDGDFRRSALAKLLNVEPSPGLADLLQGEASYEEVVQATPIPNLYFISAGETRGRTAAELLSLQQIGSIFRRLQSDFHYTLVDTPPATTVTDVGIIGQMCSGVILLVRMNLTPEPVARRAVRLLQVNNIPILGCIVVGHSERPSAYGNPYSYYRYYRDYTAKDPR